MHFSPGKLRIGLLLLFVFLLASLTFAGRRPITAVALPTAVTFSDSGQSLGSQDSSGVALADLDGDGDLDAFIANYGEDASFGAPDQVWINQGGAQNGAPGVFQDSGQTLGNFASVSVALGDLDGDADVDAVVVSDGFGDTIHVWLNQGGIQAGTEGIFADNGQAIGSDLNSDVALGALDAGNAPDIYIARSVGRADELWTSDGSGQFSDSGQTLAGGSSLAVALGDVDGDTDLDAFVVGDGANVVWINQGGAQGGTAGDLADSGQSLGSAFSLDVALGDLDGDADLDAFVANSTADKVWLNQGGLQSGTPGVFADSGQSLGTATPQSRGVALADLDGDADLDAFVATAGGNAVWINQGGDQGGTPGNFASSGQSLGSAFTEDVALGDLDGDGDPDAFTANWYEGNRVWLNGAAAPPINPEGWQRQVIDTRGKAGLYGDLALDGDGRPHLLYVDYIPRRDGRDYHLMYAHWDGVRWQQELLERTDNVGAPDAHVGIAVDGNGRPHLAYAVDDGFTGLDLIYNTWDGSQWQRQVVDSSSEAKGDVSLALTSTGQPRISYRRGVADTALYYAAWNGASWGLTAVDDDLDTDGQFNALALDSGDHPHISYFDNSNGELKYAHNDGSGWVNETVDSGFPDVGWYTAIAIDSADHPHITYLGDLDNEVRYAHWDGAVWQKETVVTVGVQQDVGAQTSLALDSADNPHIVYALEDDGNGRLTLEYVYWDGAAWQQETLDNSSRVGLFNSMALDANDNLHAIYHDQPYSDLRYVAWDTAWQTRLVDGGGVMAAPDVAVLPGQPSLSYYNQTSGQVKTAVWDAAWITEPVDFISSPIADTSLAVTPNGRHVSYYDADNQRLLYTRYYLGNWTTQIVDEVGDVGRYNDLLLSSGSDVRVRIAYWDATALRIKLARIDGGGIPILYPNTLSPALNANSGALAAAGLARGDVGVSYYDANQGDLRYALWDAQSETWVLDERAAGVTTDAGQLNAIQADGSLGYPVVAYYDATDQAIRYAYRDNSGWQISTAVPGVSTPASLSLELGLHSLQHPRIAYTLPGSDTIYVALQDNGVWRVEGVAAGGGFGGAATALDSRPHLAYPSAAGMTYAFRTATLDVDTAVFTPPSYTQTAYNPLDACLALLNFFIEGRQPLPDAGGMGLTAVTANAPLTDEQIFGGMNRLFSATANGRHFITLYTLHGSEMGQIGLSDPQLTWDAYGALQNFMPGLEAMVSGRGDEVLVTQEMVDDALDIWQRVAAAGSPVLSNAINAELARYNNLQDFVGLTFDEWAAAIGVPTPQIYLPLVAR